jgi:molybdopterin converting factor small subunit
LTNLDNKYTYNVGNTMRLSEMNNRTNVKKINKVMESRFGFRIDYDNLTFPKAYELARGLTEGLETIKRSHGVHTAEKNPRYMEMYMVRESLHRWMVENEQQLITESEMAEAEAILAAKDMVDSIQDMLEKVSKMQNEQLPALLDTIRDQIGTDKAESFKSTVGPLLSELAASLQQGRESADAAARALTGEAMDQPMDLAAPPADAGMGAGMPPAPETDLDSDEGDAFAATDAAAGGEDELGRERR